MTPDARLSAAERAALADLEAAAVAADPQLAARLRGSPAARLWGLLPALRSRLLKAWAATLKLRWWGIPVTVAGLALAVLGLSTSMTLSVFGSVVAAVGLRVLAETLQQRLAERRAAG